MKLLCYIGIHKWAKWPDNSMCIGGYCIKHICCLRCGRFKAITYEKYSVEDFE